MLGFFASLIAGLVIGSIVNMGLLALGNQLIAPPAGADMRTADGIRAALPQLRPLHFLFPFLAHALGTLSGAFIAGAMARTNRHRAALIVGGFFLMGGFLAARMIPAPTWFIACDLLLAYLPCAWLGSKLSNIATRAGK